MATVETRQHAMSSYRILGYMLRANRGRMRRVLSGMGFVPNAHNKDKDNGNGGGGGNQIEDDNNNEDAIEKGDLSLSYSLYNAPTVVLVNMGSNHNPAKFFFSSSSSASFPGGALAWGKNKNRVTGKDVVVFNNGPVKDGEVLSDGDNLSGNDEPSNDDNNGRSAGDDRDGRGDNGRKAGWDGDYSGRSNGKNKFKLDNDDGAEGGGEGRQDN
jgi:hypothetical protein